MTGLEIFLLFAGIIIMVVSFLFGEQLDGKNGADVSIDEDEIKSTVKSHVEDAVEEAIDDTVEKTAIELDKLSNEKIMAVSDYSENVLNDIAKNHEEVMFLYSMLNDKEEQIKDTVKDVEMLKKSVKNMVRQNIAKRSAKKNEKQPEEKAEPIKKSSEQELPKQQPESEEQIAKPEEKQQVEEVIIEDSEDILEEQMNNNQKILSLYQTGMSNIDIAKELNLGLGEVRLVIDLYRTRGKQ
ncbi:MAG: hypothetical protein K2I03_08055 [Lachnospiraceae bacterium]|nr:hypothetical protein [Lachnospiraceae bacterium]MDE6253685.1 hypothetical protein [Lachnospiraceae bacterium]